MARETRIERVLKEFPFVFVLVSDNLPLISFALPTELLPHITI